MNSLEKVDYKKCAIGSWVSAMVLGQCAPRRYVN